MAHRKMQKCLPLPRLEQQLSAPPSECTLYDVDDQTKRVLLGKVESSLGPRSSPLSPSPQLSDAQVLDRLENLHPPTAQMFHLKRNESQEAPLRLLFVQKPCVIESFVALSYCWHSAR